MGNEVPMGLALVVCDMHIQDKQTNKKTLVGLFDRLFASSLPCVHPSLSVFVSLTSARGNYTCEVVCRHQETGDTAFAVKGQVRFNDPLQVVEIVFNVQGVRFTQEGVYSLQCLLDDYPVMMRRIFIVRKDPNKAEG